MPSLCDGVTHVGSCCVFLRTRSERRLLPPIYSLLLRDRVTLRVECGFPPTRSKRNLLWISGRYSFRMGSPFSGRILTIWSRVKELLQLGSWERFSGPSSGWVSSSFGRPACSEVGEGSKFSCLHFWQGLCVYPSCQRRSGSCPFFFFWPCCLSPSPGGSICFGGLVVILFTWAFHALVLHAWWLASGTSGSRPSGKGLLAYDQGASDSLPHPSPGRVVEASVFGIAVWALLQTCLFHIAWNPPLLRAKDCPSLPLRVAPLPLKLSCSEVLGPHVLLSYYVAHVISCGPGVLSSLSPFLGCLSGSSELDWGSVEPLQTYEVRISDSGCALHRGLCLGWALWVFLLCLLVALFPGAGVGFLCFRHGLCGEDSGPSLAPWFAGFTVPAQPTWDNCNGRLLYPALGLRIVSDASGSFLPQSVAWRSYRRPLSPSGSGCRCHGCAGSRSRNGLFCVSWARCSRAVAQSLLWEELCCHPGGGARVWLSCSSLQGYYLGAVATRFLTSFHWFCVVAAQALVCPGPARLDISLLTSWVWSLGQASSLVRLPSAAFPWDVTVAGSCMSPHFEMLCVLFPGNIGLHFFRISRSLSNVWFFLFRSS